MGYWPVVLNALKNSDILLLITDARIPEISENKEILKKAEILKKRVFVVYNKIDLISKEYLEKLKKENINSFFTSATKKTGIKELKEFLINKSENFQNQTLRVAMVGYPNAGKSSILNLLVPKAKLKVSRISGTTKKVDWLRLGKIRFMDSPGVIPKYDRKISLGLTSSKDPHKIKNPEKVAYEVIRILNNKNKEILKRFYNLEESSEKIDETFEAIAKKKKYLLKKGEIDENKTAITIIKDWQEGRISLK